MYHSRTRDTDYAPKKHFWSLTCLRSLGSEFNENRFLLIIMIIKNLFAVKPKKLAFYLLLFLCTLGLSAQDFSKQWTGYFSYNSIQDLSYGNGKIFAAAQNSVFSYEGSTGAIETFSTIQGLAGGVISSVYYSAGHDILFVGYRSGLIDIVRRGQPVITVVDILNKTTIPPTAKEINHFMEQDGTLYISTGFGISLFDIDRLEFDDSYFIGPAGGRLNVRQTAITGGYIYAATQEGGIRRASMAIGQVGAEVPDLIDYKNWITIAPGNWLGVAGLNGNLFALSENRTLQAYNGSAFTTLANYTSQARDFTTDGASFTVSLANAIYTYAADGSLIATVTTINGFDQNYATALAVDGALYIGTPANGVLTAGLPAASSFKQILPDGPLRNDPFSVQAGANELWAVYGDYSESYNPYPLKERGLGHFKEDTGWVNKPYTEILNANNLVNVTINPENPGQVFVSSYNSGLLEINENEATQLFNTTNSGLSDIPSNPGDVRINGAAFDRMGNLWMTNSQVENALARKSGNQIEGFSVKEVLPDFARVNGYGDLVIDRQDNIYFGSSSNGIIAYNPTTKTFGKLSGGEDVGLPSDIISSLAIDNSGTLWIGTNLGLRLLFGPGQLFTDQKVEAQPIIILENSIPVEVLNEQVIQDIAVDGSNNKWVGTVGNGLFYFSPDGQKTLLQFNTSNSPLPSNTINDISIDNITGKVYFATPLGLVSYNGSAVGPAGDLQAVRAYPNPVRPQYKGPVTIDGLTARADVKITDVAGNLVYEEVSAGGSIQWDTTAFGKYKVASGVYLILVTASDATETKTSKIMIIR